MSISEGVWTVMHCGPWTRHISADEMGIGPRLHDTCRRSSDNYHAVRGFVHVSVATAFRESRSIGVRRQDFEEQRRTRKSIVVSNVASAPFRFTVPFDTQTINRHTSIVVGSNAFLPKIAIELSAQ
jgi:hypothetical protein